MVINIPNMMAVKVRAKDPSIGTGEDFICRIGNAFVLHIDPKDFIFFTLSDDITPKVWRWEEKTIRHCYIDRTTLIRVINGDFMKEDNQVRDLVKRV